MKYIQGTSRSQTLLLPACVDDYVGPDNVVRFIEAFVNSLDLAVAGFERTLPKATGRPGYDPCDLLKLYIYGYLNRVRSSWRLEFETHRNLEVIWLMRQLRTDFKTIADFRRENKKAFRQVFREFVVLCRSLDLFGRELIAVDGIFAFLSIRRSSTPPLLAVRQDQTSPGSLGAQRQRLQPVVRCLRNRHGPRDAGEGHSRSSRGRGRPYMARV
jgi:transposase